MASLSSLGIGSGLDVSGLVSKLMEQESQPLVALTQKEATIQAKISAFGSIKGSLSALQNTLQALGKATTFTSTTATVSDTTVLGTTAGAGAAAGDYNIEVTQLAKSHVLRTAADYSTEDTFNPGTLTLTVGENSTSISIRSGENDTLAGIARSINEANAGVNAAVINTGSTQRLVLTSATTGAEGAITVEASELGSGATHSLADFAYSGADSTTMVQAQRADDAIFSINNIEISRSSNTVTDAIDGLTLNLAKTGSTRVTLQSNPDAATSAINIFVKAYNDLAATLKKVSAYDAETKKGSTLTGDSTVRNLDFQLANLTSDTVAGRAAGSAARLSDIGITRQLDGTLKVDDAKLKAALNDPSKDVMGLFTATAVGDNAKTDGIAARFSKAITGMIGKGGPLTARTDGLNSTIKDIGNQRTVINQRLETVQANYLKQFQALDSLLSSMTSTSNYLTQQLSALANLNSGN